MENLQVYTRAVGMFKQKDFAAVTLVKIVLMAVFSSCYQDELFVPFVSHFTANLDNPWQYFYSTGSTVEFPYHPLMLYTLSAFYIPAKALSGGSPVVINLLFKMPTLLSDLLVAWLLLRLMPNKRREVLIFYFASPIIIYSCYMHSQLDMMPTALLFLSTYLLSRGRTTWSAVSIGLAACMKLHVMAALPLMLVYMVKVDRKKDIPLFLLVIAGLYAAFSYPYIMSDGYFYMVLANKKQSLLFDTFYGIGGLSLYLPIFASLIVYMRFAFYNKVNDDLFFTFVGILFSVFIFLVAPSPGWYVWILPFLSIFYIKLYARNSRVMYMHAALSAAYVAFFVFFHVSEFCELTFLGTPVDLKLGSLTMKNAAFTGLETVLFGTVYAMYRFGVKSNSIYKKHYATVIGIGGDSGSGKSVLLSDIKAMLGDKVLEVEGDGAHKWERYDKNWQNYTHLDPKANDLHRQATNIFALKMGRSVFMADYDHDTGRFTEPREVAAKEFVIMSGLHTFYLPLMRKLVDLKIYMDTDDRLRKHWKVLRDTSERGYTKEAILAQMEKRTPDADRFIHPQREFADMTITYYVDGEFDIGDAAHGPDVKLKVTLSASVHVDELLNRIIASGVEVAWDYADDLKSQYIILGRPPDASLIENMSAEVIPNIDEITTDRSLWSDGYRGFVQMLVLMVLSEKSKEASEPDEV